MFLDDRLPARFWDKVIPEPNSGCWLWIGATTLQGYGRISVGNRKCEMAHRFAYRGLVGAFDENLDLDHLCRVGLCVNPLHLEPVTHRENMLRGDTIGARQVARINATGTCIHGHDYAANVIVRKNGKRECRECHRIRLREAYYRDRCEKVAKDGR